MRTFYKRALLGTLLAGGITLLGATVTGAAIETIPWSPESRPSSPDVSAVAGAAAGAGAGAGAVAAASVDELSPTTETALPDTVTGTFTDTRPCVPEPMPSEPLVVASTGAGAGAGAAVAPVLDLSLIHI